MDAKEKTVAGLIRRCLTQRYLLRTRSQEVFAELIRHEARLTTHFAAMAVRLVINDALGIAYLEPIAELEEDIGYQLGRRKRLGALETVALVKLRSKRMEFFAGSIDSETPIISRLELREFLRDFVPSLDERTLEKQFNSVVRNLVEHRILHESDSERFEVTPVCDVLLSGDQIRSLLDRGRAYFGVGHPVQSGEGKAQ